ncbi:Quinolinate phosphoribosyl transferase, C-terminal [Pseudocohnilembus persalinus]|uniref:Nicotinate phosphoribosyltransferase n=1 Tax=Pseudocohnilembus persalinus TaxID=266149 RepID=A0A0V0R260_PSEPJ|nr:Quinolinate phosphoribosyl transferase, C-terminal [Pseudocohnilembus persalinus]|eukprot:KRX08606.1 Quinolinate phosphoribosyl transferase, C-terminal [Pseudocohnilembus persalinus]
MDSAVFELFFRSAPFEGKFAVFAGVEEIMSFFKYFKFTESHISYLKTILPNKKSDEAFYNWLKTLGPHMLKVSCQKEGSIVFPKEPLLNIEGPLGLIKLLEAPMISLTSFPTLVATNAARMRSVVPLSKQLYEYGLRRAQGSGAALVASRYAYLGGFQETSNLLASNRYNIPLSSTHSHAFVTAFRNLDEIDEFELNGIQIKERTNYYRKILEFNKTSESELAAFLAHAKAFPKNFICLVDSFDSITSGIPNFIIVAFALMDAGYSPFGVRIDSGDLVKISLTARSLIDNAGRQVNKNTSNIKIMVSNKIGEKELKEFSEEDHEIDIFAIETELVVCEDQPHLGMVFKLVDINGKAAMKFSEDPGKSTLPGKKTLYRVWVASQTEPIADIVALPDEDIMNNKEIDVVSIQQTQSRYTIIPQKIERIYYQVIDQGQLISKVNDLEESKLHLEEQKKLFGPNLMDDEKQYMLVLTVNYWNYFQEAAQKSLIPKIIH